MRKNMVRIFALILVLAMAVGFLAMIPAQATDSNAVQIVFNNVEYGEKLSLMYAVYGEEVNYETDVAVTLYTDAACTQKWCDATYSYTATEGKIANCGIFIADKGVPAQAIDTVVYAKATANGASSLVQRYSVLEYLHKRLSVDVGAGKVSAEQKTMYETLLNFAAAAQPVIYKTDPYTPINNYTYVHVDNGTYKGYATGMYLQGGTIALSDLAADGTVLSWNYQIVGGESGELTDTLTIGAQDIILTAEIDETAEPSEPEETTPTEPELAGRYYIATVRSSGNYYYMTSDLGTANTKRYTAVDSGLAELPEKITGVIAGYAFGIEANDNGTYYIYADIDAEAKYLGWSSGNSGILVKRDAAKALTVDAIEGGLYNIHFTGDEERYLSLNEATGSDYFAWYKGTQKQDLALIPIEECDHAYDDSVVTAPTCTVAGFTTYTCSKCGFETKCNEVAATGHLNTETTAAVEATCQSVGYTAGTFCNDCNTYVDGHAEVAVVDCVYENGACKWCGAEEPSEPEETEPEPAEPVTKDLSFADKAQRTEFSTAKQVWTQNGITLINEKSSSTSSVADYAKPARFYANSKIVVEAEGKITKVVFDCNNTSYATAMKNSIGTISGATVTVSSDKVTVEFAEAVESLTVAKLTAQVRMDSITVTYIPE